MLWSKGPRRDCCETCGYLFVPKWEKIESLFPKKKENKTMEGGVVINNVALPEMLLTSSPVQQFHLFFSSRFLIYLPIPHISIHLHSPSFLCHLSSCCSLLLGNASPHPVPSLIPHLSFVLLSPFFTPLLLLKGRKILKKKNKKKRSSGSRWRRSCVSYCRVT